MVNPGECSEQHIQPNVDQTNDPTSMIREAHHHVIDIPVSVDQTNDVELLPPSRLMTVATSLLQVLCCLYVFRRLLRLLPAAGRGARHLWEYVIEEGDFLGRHGGEAIIVIAQLIATLNFQLLSSPPGGVYEETLTIEGKDVHEAGTAIAAYRSPIEHQQARNINYLSLLLCIVTVCMYGCHFLRKCRIFSYLMLVLLLVIVNITAYTSKLAAIITTPSNTYKRERELDFMTNLANIHFGGLLVVSVGFFLFCVWRVL